MDPRRAQCILSAMLLLCTMVGFSHASTAQACWQGSPNYNKNYNAAWVAATYHKAAGANAGQWVFAALGSYSETKIYRTRADGSEATVLVCNSGCGNRTLTGYKFPMSMYVEPTEEKLYWFDYTGGYIGRINMFGNGLPEIVVCNNASLCSQVLSDLGGLTSMQVDAVITKRLYWTDRDFIGSASLPGAGSFAAKLLCRPGRGCFHDMQLSAPQHLKLDLTQSPYYMYWTQTGRVSRAQLDGTNAQFLFCTDACTGICGGANYTGTTCVRDVVMVDPLYMDVDVTASSKKIYWSDSITGRIFRGALDASSVEIVVCNDGCPHRHPGGADIRAINHLSVVGGENPVVYYVDPLGVGPSSNQARINRVNGDGSGATTILCGGRAKCNARYARLDLPSLAQMGKGNKLAFTWISSYGVVYFEPGTNTVLEPALLNVNRVSSLVSRSGGGLNWAVNGRVMLEASNGCNFAPGNTGTAKQIMCPMGCGQNLRHLMGNPTEIKVVNNKLYWVDQTIGAIGTSNFDGTGAKQVVCSLNCPHQVSPTHVPKYLQVVTSGTIGGKLFWIADDVSNSIYSANLDGSSISKLQCNDGCPTVQPAYTTASDLKVDTRTAMPVLYWLDRGSFALVRMNGDGTSYNGVACASTCSTAARNIGSEYFSSPMGLQLDLNADQNSRAIWVDLSLNLVVAVRTDQLPQVAEVIACGENDGTGKCSHVIAGLQALSGETALIVVNGNHWFYYGVTLASGPAIYRQLIRSASSPLGNAVGAPQAVVCKSGCANAVKTMADPKQFTSRLNPKTNSYEFWWADVYGSDAGFTTGTQALYRATLTGAGAHANVAENKLIPK